MMRCLLDDGYSTTFVGYTYNVEIATILSEPSKYKEFMVGLEDDRFTLKKLYNRLWDYYTEIKSRQEPTGADLFDFLN